MLPAIVGEHDFANWISANSWQKDVLRPSKDYMHFGAVYCTCNLQRRWEKCVFPAYGSFLEALFAIVFRRMHLQWHFHIFVMLSLSFHRKMDANLGSYTGVFIINAHFNMVHLCLPPPSPLPMLLQRCDVTWCPPFHKKRPLLHILCVCFACQHWTRGIGGEPPHPCLVCSMGVYYENTGTLFQVVHPPH